MGISRTIALILLLGMAAQSYFAVHKSTNVVAYQHQIAEIAAQIPARCGGWIGQDVAVPTQSLAVLKPNVMISKHYINVENGSWAGVMFVHCGDAHHMIGHYPLRCYPARGWTTVDSRPRDWQVGNVLLTGTEYHFHQDAGLDSPYEQSIVVVNFLFRPGGKILRDMESMSKTIVGAGGSASGAGQMQIYFDESVPQTKRDAAIIELAGGYRPLIEAVLADPAAKAN